VNVAQRARGLLDQLRAAEKAGAQHEQHERALIGCEGRFGVAFDLDAQRAEPRHELVVQIVPDVAVCCDA